MSVLSTASYVAIKSFLEDQAGIVLGEGKEYLVSSRLSRLLPTYNFTNCDQLLDGLKRNHPPGLRTQVVDAMTTNETFWFRDVNHYRVLIEQVLPEFNRSRIRLWSAAASTGQESYSVAITLQNAISQNRLEKNLQYEIVGTDISPSAIKQAQQGRYCGVSIGRGLSDDQRRRYFDDDGQCIEVKAQYKKGVQFKEFNLLTPYTSLGRFDVIFCRNVLIYFSQATKRDILQRLAGSLNVGGYLFVGSTESMYGNEDLFNMIKTPAGLVYQKR